MIVLPRTPRYRTPIALMLLAALLSVVLAACDVNKPVDKTYALATVFPTTGANAAIGQAMQRAVDLAVKQNASLGKGYTLTVDHTDEASVANAQAAAQVIANTHVLGIVGPFGSDTAVTLLPVVEQAGVATISPGATLPGLTQAGAAASEGLTASQLHPKGKPVAFFRLPRTDAAIGTAAADLAIAPTSAHGLDARSVFVVDDGTLSGKVTAAAFAQELKTKQGTVAGQQSLALGSASGGGGQDAQSIVSAIVESAPDAVFFAGSTAAAAALRSTLSLTGAPLLRMLAAGTIGNDPGWSAVVGVTPAAAYTTALVPAPDPSALTSPAAKSFAVAYAGAYPGQPLLAQSALAYDAAMDEIAAIKSVVASGKAPTPAAVLAAVAAAKYTGVTGTLAFDANGDNTTPLGMSIYTFDTKGAWQYQTGLGG